MTLTAPDLAQAFDRAHFQDDADLPSRTPGGLDSADRALLYWETEADTGRWQPFQTIIRRDQPLHRQRWQFSERREHQAYIDRRREE